MDEAGRGPGNPTETPTRKKRKLSRLSKWLLWIGAIVLVLLVAAGIAISILLRRAEPMLRASLIDTLQKRFHARVELDDLHVSVLNGLQAEGSGLRIWLPTEAQANLAAAAAAPPPAPPKPSAVHHPNEKVSAASTITPAQVEEWKTRPWIVVDRIRFHTTARIRPGEPIVIPVIYIEGVRVLLPPKADRPHLSLSGESNTNPTSEPQAQPSSSPAPESSQVSRLFKIPTISVQRVECKNAELVIERTQESGKPPKVPLTFEFEKVTVFPDGIGHPMAFSVDMVNAKPVGNIHSTGHAGPWVPGDPGALPLEGDYSFDHADLSTIKGIAGILSSTGHYQGTLRVIEADGDTQTPDFRLERVDGRGESLTTHFHAIIDGTNGDTQLEPVDAILGHTHIIARGAVLRAEDATGQKRGHDIALEVTIDHGRIEDILQISANQDSPFLTGNLTMQTHLHLPPGQESVIDKLQLAGQFHLTGVRFDSEKIQGGIRQLSLRGQGKPGEVKTTDPDTVLSEMQGHFKLGGGTLDLPDLSYRVPGAEIQVQGSYGMKAGSLNFAGDAKLEAPLSQVVGGWKGLLLMPADHYLRKNGAGTDVPIHVEGTRKDPKFGVDFNRLGKNDKPQPTGP